MVVWKDTLAGTCMSEDVLMKVSCGDVNAGNLEND